MKKVFSVSLVILLLALLAACGGGSAANTPSSPTETQPLPLTPSANAPDAGFTDTTPKPDTPTDEKEYGGYIRLITTGDTSYAFGLPWNSAANFATQVQIAWGDCLVLEDLGGKIYPWLAERWEIDVEKQEIRFFLRDNVSFTDGTKFNAEAAIWNLEKGRESGALNPASFETIEKRGEYEFAVVMGGEFNNTILNTLATRTSSFISPDFYEKNGADYAGEHPVGTGPFIMTQKDPGVKVVYEKNENFWLPGKPYLDGYEYVNITDMMTQNAALMSSGPDAVDVFSAPSALGEQLAVLQTDPNLNIHAYSAGPTVMYPSSNNPDSPYASLEIRQAISYAIDRELISEARGFGFMKPSTQLISDNYYGHLTDGVNHFPYDLDKAKELMAQGGYPDGFKTTLYSPTTADPEVTVIIQDMLQAIGIEADMQFPERGLATELRTVTGWEGLFFGAFTNLPSIDRTYTLQVDDKYFYNISTWRPLEKMEKDYGMMRTTPSLDNDVFTRLHTLMIDEMVIIPIIDRIAADVSRKSVRDGAFSMWGSGTQWDPTEIWRSTK